MKKLIRVGLMAVAFLSVYCSKASAFTFVSEYTSSMTVAGFTCSSGTASQIDASTSSATAPITVPGVSERQGVRIVNLDATNGVYIGFDVSVSSINSNPRVGELVTAGQSAPYPAGKKVAIWCIAPNAAGSAGVRISFLQTGVY